MANRRASSDYFENVTVDTAPGADGYWSNVIGTLVSDRSNKVGVRSKDSTEYKVYFSVRGTGSGIVTLQFLCPGDPSWNDYATYNQAACKQIMVGQTGIQWRGGVKQGDYVSGDLVCGFDW